MSAEEKDKSLWLAVRQGLLLIVSAIERRFGISKEDRKAGQ